MLSRPQDSHDFFQTLAPSKQEAGFNDAASLRGI